MATFTLRLSDELQKKVKAKAADGGFKDIDEYIENLLVEDCTEQEYDEELERLLIERLESGPGIEATPEFFQQLRNEVSRKHLPARS